MLGLALLIFVAELTVVTVSTVRTIFIARGMKVFAAMIGTAEVMIWLFAISQIMRNLDSPLCFGAYALGFVIGNYLGVELESRLALGFQGVRITARTDATELIAALRGLHFGVTTIDARGATGPVQVIYTIVRRKQVRRVIELIDLHAPKAFYVIEDVRTTTQGVFPPTRQKEGTTRPTLLPFPKHAAA